MGDPTKYHGLTFGKDGHLKIVGHLEPEKYKDRLYLVRCSVCYLDPEKYGEGVFKSNITNLKMDQIPCGCAPHRVQPEREFLVDIDRICTKKNFTIVSYKIAKNISKTRIIVKCKEGHEWDSCKATIVKSGCPICAGYGYQRNKPAYFYVLLTGNGSKEFCGYGITCNIDIRLRTHKSNLLKKGFIVNDIESFYFESGEDALNLERNIKRKFDINPQNVVGFKREATFVENYLEIVGICEDFIDEA